MIGAVAGVLFPVAAVWLAMVALRLHVGIRSRAVIAAIAVCAGLGLSSLTTTWLLALGMVIGRVFVVVDALLWTSLGALAWWHLRRLPPAVERQSVGMPAELPRGLTTTDWLVRGLFGVVVAFAVVSAVAAYVAAPHGEWDAWAIWNQKARFLYRGDAGLDGAAGDRLVEPRSPPARTYDGCPAVGVCRWRVNDRARDGGHGVWCGNRHCGRRCPRCALRACVDRRLGSSRGWNLRSADRVPAGRCAVCVLSSLDPDRAPGAGLLLLAGTLAGLAAWTKNEGLPVVVVTGLLVVWIALRHAQPRLAAWWVVGAAPAMMTVAWFKLVVAPVAPQYLTEAPTLALLLERLLGPERHAVVDGLLWQQASAWGGPLANGVVPLGVVAATLVAVTRAGRSARAILGVVGVMVTSYYGIYLLTSLDVEWLVMTTFDRLMVQIWPALVLAAFLTDDEPAPAHAAARGA